MKTLFLCGAGNSEGIRLAYAINRVNERWSRMFVLDDDFSRHGQKLLGCEIVGGFESLAGVDRTSAEVVNLVARRTLGRAAARERITTHAVPFARLVSPTVDTYGAEIAHDAIVYHNATIGPESEVGEGAVVFMGSVVGHEVRVGEGCVVAANAVLNARVVLGQGVYVGSNATILPEIEVGAWATIGAGTVVVEDVPEGATVMGVPGEILSQPTPDADIRVDPGVRQIPDLEEVIRDVWQRILPASFVGFDDAFFDLGGSSLLALRMREHVQRATGVRIALTDIFRFPTVRSLAAHLAGNRHDRVSGTSRTRAEIRRAFQARRQVRQ